jgi:hypothetical protein
VLRQLHEIGHLAEVVLERLLRLATKTCKCSIRMITY